MCFFLTGVLLQVQVLTVRYSRDSTVYLSFVVCVNAELHSDVALHEDLAVLRRE